MAAALVALRRRWLLIDAARAAAADALGRALQRLDARHGAAHDRGLEALASAALGSSGGRGLCGFQPLVWGVPTKLQNSLARSNQGRFG